MARLAIIVPHLGSPKLLEDTLLSVLSNRPGDCEVVVVLGRAYADPYDLEGEVQFVPMPRRVGWIECVTAGMAKSRSPIVHLLATGAEAAEGWADAALRHFDDSRVAAVAPLVLDHERPKQVVAAGMSYHMSGMIRALARGKPANEIPRRPRGVLAPHPAAAFYRRSILECAGGLDRRSGDRLACVDLGLVLRELGLRTVLEPRCRVTVRPEAMFRRGDFRDAMESERFFWRWAGTTGLMRSLALHGALLAGESVRSLWNLSIVARWTGRLAGVSLALGRGGAAERVKELRQAFRDRPLDATVKAPHFPATTSRKRTPEPGDVARRRTPR